MNNKHHLILGGARSGKSSYAQQLAISSGLQVIYVATGQAGDAEMQARIQKHKSDRPAHWLTLEEPQNLIATLAANASEKHCLLVDCLTLWVSNLMHDQSQSLQQQSKLLFDQLPELPGVVLLVSNEVGLGITPINPLARKFIDEVGLLHQQLAQVCGQVVLMTAGLPHYLKGSNDYVGST